MIERITPRKLNKDTDERSLKPTELKDAMNISVGIDTEGDSGVLKLADGNEYVSLSDAMASIDGVKTVLGSVEDEELGVIYFFVHNSNSNHAIFAYSSKTNTYRLIFSHPSLNFSSTGFVKGDIVRVKRKFAMEAASVLGEQGEDGGNTDFQSEGDGDPVFTDPAVRMRLTLVRDLVIFEEIARNVYQKGQLASLLGVDSWVMSASASINGGLSAVPFYPSEEDALLGTNAFMEFSDIGSLQFGDFGSIVDFNFGGNADGAGADVEPLWLRSSDFNNDSFEMVVELKYVGPSFDTFGMAAHSAQEGSEFGVITVETEGYSEVVVLNNNSFTADAFDAVGRQRDVSPNPFVVYDDSPGPGFQKVWGKPERNRMNITISEVFSHPMLGQISAVDGSFVEGGYYGEYIFDPMMQLGQYDVQVDGSSVQTTTGDPLLTDRTAKVSLRVGFGGALKAYTQLITDFATAIGTSEGPDDWYNGEEEGLGFRQADLGSTDDGGGGSEPPASNIYGVVWCPSSAQFKLYYCTAANYVDTVSGESSGSPFYGWAENYEAAQNEMAQYCYGPQTTAGFNAVKDNWVRINHNFNDYGGHEVAIGFNGTNTTWIEEPGQFADFNTGMESGSGANFPISMRTVIESHYESVHGEPAFDPSTGQYRFWPLLINTDGNSIGGVDWQGSALAYDPYNVNIKRQFYMDHFPLSQTVYEDFPYVANVSTFAQETYPEYLESLGMEQTSLDYVAYIASLPYLTYNVNYKLGFGTSESSITKRAAIVNYDWDGRDNTSNAFIIKYEPIDLSGPNQTGLKAYTRTSSGDDVLISDDASKFTVAGNPSSALSGGELPYSVTLTNGINDVGIPYRGCFVPLKREQEEGDPWSQLAILNPYIYNMGDQPGGGTLDGLVFLTNGDLRLGAYTDDNPDQVQAFAWGTNEALPSSAGIPADREGIPASDANVVQEVSGEDSGQTDNGEANATSGESNTDNGSSTSSLNRDSIPNNVSKLGVASKTAKQTIRKKY